MRVRRKSEIELLRELLEEIFMSMEVNDGRLEKIFLHGKCWLHPDGCTFEGHKEWEWLDDNGDYIGERR